MVVVDNLQDARIMEILEWKDGQSQPYLGLRNLYEDNSIQSVVGTKFFDKSGSVRFLSTLPSNNETISEFEKALVALYKRPEAL